MKEVPLTRGMVALVDDSDYELVSKYKWMASFQKKRVYAMRAGGIYMHRLILGLTDGYQADHKNLNGIDNRRENLRICINEQNSRNREKWKKKCSSRFKGVYFSKRLGKYLAYINLLGKRINIGCFVVETEAAMAYNKKALELHGEFACLNKI